MYVPILVDHSEPEEEDWEDVDEVLRGSTCYACGMMEHLARDRAKHGARRKADMEAMDTPKDKGRRRKAQEIKVQAHL